MESAWGIKMDRTEEKRFLEGYDINAYDRPSIAADIAVFSLGRKASSSKDYRRLPQKKLRILMIRRAQQPFMGAWALPGGFMKRGETIYETARRELKEETGTDKAYLELCHVFSDSGHTDGDGGRDPRGWIVSQAFMAILNDDDIANGQFAAGGDAGETAWFDVTVEKIAEQRQEQGKSIACDSDHKLTLQKDGETLEAVIREHMAFRDHHAIVTYEIVSSEGFAFDHARIITCAVNRMRSMLKSDVRLAFDFMPEHFTLTDLQETVELISGQTLIKPNFRRKIADHVVETDQFIQNGGHRPAKAFVRNLEKFYQ